MATTNPSGSAVTNGPSTPTLDKLEDKPLSAKEWWEAYRATLVAMGTVVHIIASVVTVLLYFLLPPSSPRWFAPVYGALFTYLVFLFVALFCADFVGTIKGTSTRSYGVLKTRLCQLHARLDALGITEKTLASPGPIDYTRIARSEAYRCYEMLNCYLGEHSTGLRWVTGIGYLNAWSLLHRAEEALIKVEPPQMVLCGALHDKLAIQDSTIRQCDELLEKLIQAAADLDPAAAAIYFKEHQPDATNDKLLYKLAEAINKIATTQPQIDLKALETPCPEQQDAARWALSEVRRTLNDFRDSLQEELIRERNKLLNTVGVTGLVTHILLCIAIVTSSVIDRPLIMAATVFYIVGAVSGLFARVYNEVNTNAAIDDFGLSLARLITTPLLSGLAGIGGVIITLVLSNALTSTPEMTLSSVFKVDPNYLLTAAAFGLAPNMIISGLQQRTAKYTSDLQKSKGGGK